MRVGDFKHRELKPFRALRRLRSVQQDFKLTVTTMPRFGVVAPLLLNSAFPSRRADVELAGFAIRDQVDASNARKCGAPSGMVLAHNEVQDRLRNMQTLEPRKFRNAETFRSNLSN